MKKLERILVVLAIVLAGSLGAAGLMNKLTPNSSWLGYIAWTVFFVSLQLPWLLVKPDVLDACTSWLNLRKR